MGGGILDAEDAGDDETGGDCEASCAGGLAGGCPVEGELAEEVWAAAIPMLALTAKARNKKRISLFYFSQALREMPADLSE